MQPGVNVSLLFFNNFLTILTYTLEDSKYPQNKVNPKFICDFNFQSTQSHFCKPTFSDSCEYSSIALLTDSDSLHRMRSVITLIDFRRSI